MRKPALLAALALFLLSAWEIVTLVRVRASTARDDDWRRAAEAVHAERHPGDLIVFAPAWVDPVGRKWLGALMTIADAARMDDARWGRVWEVSIRGASAGIAGDVKLDQRFGQVRVRLFERPAARVTWDLRDRSRLLEVDFQPRLCAPLHPPAEIDATAPLGSKLVVYAGISDFRSRRENRAHAILHVLVDGREVAQQDVSNESGWVRLPDITTTPGTHALSFLGASNDRHTERLDLCVAAEARE